MYNNTKKRNGSKKLRGSSKSNFAPKKPERNNFQDRAMNDQKKKGFKEGYENAKFEDARVRDTRHTANDPQWYFKSNNLLNDVASFSYAQPLGADLRPDRILAPLAPSKNSGGLNAVPGLMSITLAPTPGIARDAQDPINVAAQNVYSFVRYKNSGAANYDAPDLMLYLIAMDSVYMAWNWMKRLYGMASTYSVMNKYKPKAYMLANGVDIDDIYAHLADFRAYLNMAANKISAFCVPAVFTYMVRHSWLFSNIYKDAETTKAQEYMYVPAFFYTYDETTSPQGGLLKPINVLYNKPANLYKFSDLRQMLDTIINSLVYSEDIGIMSGDILKAYGEGSLYHLSEIEPDFRVDAVYNRGVLSQIENARMCATILKGANLSIFNITQDPDTNYILYQPKVVSDNPWNDRMGHYLNFHWDNPTPEDVIEATRLTYTTTTTQTAGKYTISITDCGSELFIGGNIYYYAQAEDFMSDYSPSALMNIYTAPLMEVIRLNDKAADIALSFAVRYIWLWTAFDWAPTFTFTVQSSTGTRYTSLGLRDWDVYTVLQNQNIQALNALALQSEFNIPN